MAIHQQTSLEPTGAGELEPTSESKQLWVELEIDRVAKRSCPVRKFEDETVNGNVQLAGERCHAVLTVDGPTGKTRRTVTGRISADCPCFHVCDQGVTPAEISVKDGSLAITAAVESREHLYDLSDRFEETGDVWHLQRLTTDEERVPAEPGRDDRLPKEISLTDKQREVVEEAVRRGYYASPRDVSLSDLAEDLGVTRSALSQRLNAVEAKLIKTLAAEL